MQKIDRNWIFNIMAEEKNMKGYSRWTTGKDF